MAEDNELLPTAEVAQQLGLKEGTIRAWLSRYPEIFREGDHHVTLENKRFWTPAGVELLRGRATENVAQPATLQATASVDPLLPDPDANATEHSAIDELAFDLLEEHLPGLVRQAVQRILYSPRPADRARLKVILERLSPQLHQITTRAALESGAHLPMLESSQPLVLEGNDDGR